MTVSDGQQSVSVVFYIRVVPPPFHVHRRLSVFAAAAPAVTTVDKAVFGVWRVPCVTIPHVVGRVVLAAEMEAGQLSCVAGTGEINAYRRCRCGKSSRDNDGSRSSVCGSPVAAQKKIHDLQKHITTNL